MELSVIIPFYNGDRRVMDKLLETLEGLKLPTIIVDDMSERKILDAHGMKVLNLNKKGYFSGAVNAGIQACKTDVLVLNQDISLRGDSWLNLIAEHRDEFAMIGEKIRGVHPAWKNGYIKGSFMFMRRDALDEVGLFDTKHFPHWGSTADWQVRICRKGFRVKPFVEIPGYRHLKGRGPFGSSTVEILQGHRSRYRKLIKTPPRISVIVPSFNHGAYLQSAVNSLVGGETDLGMMPGQTYQGFEIIIVDDASTDIESRKIAASFADDWKGIKFVQRNVNGGTSAANNSGIRVASGKYVTVMCGDDMMESQRLEKMLALIEKNQDKVIYDNLQEFRDSKRIDHVLPDGKTYPHMKMREYNFDKLIYKNQMHCGIMFKRHAWKVVGGYPEAMRYGREDWAMNVALGVNGYCGMKLPEALYLYRREHQNRTLKNTTPKWHKFFLGQLERLFPRIYAGERPDMCCGNRNEPTVMIKNKPMAILQGVNGMTLLEYVGKSVGTQSWYGAISGKRYQFGLTKNKIQNVNQEDLQTGSQARPGFLEIRENGQVIFKIKEPVKVVVKPSTAEQVAFQEIPEIVEEEELLPPETVEPEQVKSRPQTSVAAQNLIDEEKLDPAQIIGTGKNGKITITDVRRHLEVN